jgi:hypothetical protein
LRTAIATETSITERAKGAQAHGKEAAVAVPTPTLVEATRAAAQVTVMVDEAAGARSVLVVAEVEVAMIEVGEDVVVGVVVSNPRTPMGLLTLSLLLTSQLPPVANLEPVVMYALQTVDKYGSYYAARTKALLCSQAIRSIMHS